MNTTWHSSPIAAATSSPVRPGMRMSRNAIVRRDARRTARAPRRRRRLRRRCRARATPRRASPSAARASAARLRRSARSGRSSAGISRGELRRRRVDGRAHGQHERARRSRAASFSSSSSAARSPWSSASRSRMLARPMPCARRAAAEARAGVGDVDAPARAAVARRRARRRCAPPPRQGSMPCLIAFSTSVISMPGGIAQSASVGRDVDRATRARAPSRVCMIARYAPHHRRLLPQRRRLVAQRGRRRAQEADQIGDQPRGLGRALLRELLRAAERVEQEVRLDLQLQELAAAIRRAAATARSAAPRPRGARSCARIRDCAGCAISATSERVEEAEHQRRGDDVAQLALSNSQANGSTPLTQAGERARRRTRRAARAAASTSDEAEHACPGTCDSRTTPTSPDQSSRQHDDVEQDRRFGERHVPRQARRDPRRPAWCTSDDADEPEPAAARDRTSGRTRARRAARSRRATRARARRTRRSGGCRRETMRQREFRTAIARHSSDGAPRRTSRRRTR